MRPIMPPSAQRTLVDRLAHLDGARGLDDAARLMRRQAIVIPIQSAKGDQVSNDRRRVFDEVLIAHDLDWRRQHPRPMGHEFLVSTVVGPNVFERPGKVYD